MKNSSDLTIITRCTKETHKWKPHIPNIIIKEKKKKKLDRYKKLEIYYKIYLYYK